MTELAVRREARRKRILENSESRLRRISSLHQDPPGDTGLKHNPDIEPLFSLLNNHSLQSEDDVNTDENREINSLVINKELGVKENTEVPVTSKHKKLFIIIFIVLLVKSLLVLCSRSSNILKECTYISGIFLPLLSYELIDIVAVRSPIKENHLLNTLLFLTNVPTKYTRPIVRVFNVFGAILQDTFLYIFVFIIIEIGCFVSLGI